MESYSADLIDMMKEQGAVSAPFSNEVALFSAALQWSHRDPFDRILAATAILSGNALISADTIFDTLDDPRLQRVW